MSTLRAAAAIARANSASRVAGSLTGTRGLLWQGGAASSRLWSRGKPLGGVGMSAL